ncbi:hypothetical protein L21SP5_02230 [Salinivirga cyanobacteriivorans]|uniref:DUF3108 domain-containing protein n=1 Tax=Salinivirga cyanobacteriivorans TaxID=1307839 RepID=A0A0S2I0U7_9BACT|nr:DUF3108 domain-containing protein [Salinivirga cyanobacteriivorans]ALO15863.1 hypothetical protein L21SP5_02230 [Salinivirga cyanobacteriivorans]
MIRRFYLLVFLFAVQSAFGQCGIEQKVFRAGEKLTYKAYFNWNFIWLEAADVEFTVTHTANKRAYNFTSIGTSLPKYDWLYKVRDTFRSKVNVETLQPWFYHRNTSEGSYRVNNKYHFNYSDSLIYTDTDNSDFGKAMDTIAFPDCTFDVLSAIYYTRSLDFDHRKIGEKIPITFIIDNELYDLYIRYLGKETIETRTGDIYKCVKFNILLVEGTIFEGGEDMTVWATDDRNHIPVLVEAKIVLGKVKAFLTDYQNIKYPLSGWLGKGE